MKIYQNLKTSLVHAVSILAKRYKNTSHIVVRPCLAVIICIFVAAFIFYWFEWRPRNIVKNCDEDAHSQAVSRYRETEKVNEDHYWPNDYDFYYKRCLRSKGL